MRKPRLNIHQLTDKSELVCKEFDSIDVIVPSPIAGNARVPFGERVPDIRYPVSGQRKLSRLSNDDVLYTILYLDIITSLLMGSLVWMRIQSFSHYRFPIC